MCYGRRRLPSRGCPCVVDRKASVGDRRLISETEITVRRTCDPCSRFPMKTTILCGSKTIVRNMGIRGISFNTAGYTRQATLFANIAQNCHGRSMTTVTVTNSASAFLPPYDVYQRIVIRLYNCRAPICLSGGRKGVGSLAVGRLIPCTFARLGVWGRLLPADPE